MSWVVRLLSQDLVVDLLADEPEKKAEEAPEESNAGVKEPNTQPEQYKYPIDTEWTKEGVEEVLATVGLQCLYNTAVCLIYILHSAWS